MKLHNKLERAIANRDINAYLNLLHEDFTVAFHKSGNSLSKEEWVSMVAGMLANEKFINKSSHCVYEDFLELIRFPILRSNTPVSGGFNCGILENMFFNFFPYW